MTQGLRGEKIYIYARVEKNASERVHVHALKLNKQYTDVFKRILAGNPLIKKEKKMRKTAEIKGYDMKNDKKNIF